eukprot:TRINITY_DN42061_c0_g2_i4.p2 TRINITY_DN42061_c0_g2~~TRINITY_DN42061_c0_g2_i4.p2  ORF type:complete len:421 (-),score=90.91 TRINITY_DN42061_c0_g2_i4:181-1443(-)
MQAALGAMPEPRHLRNCSAGGASAEGPVKNWPGFEQLAELASLWSCLSVSVTGGAVFPAGFPQPPHDSVEVTGPDLSPVRRTWRDGYDPEWSATTATASLQEVSEPPSIPLECVTVNGAAAHRAPLAKERRLAPQMSPPAAAADGGFDGVAAASDAADASAPLAPTGVDDAQGRGSSRVLNGDEGRSADVDGVASEGRPLEAEADAWRSSPLHDYQVCLQRLSPSCYRLHRRKFKVEWLDPGRQDELVVVDGPLRQPLLDYICNSETNAEYDSQGIQSQSALHKIPVDKRMSFDDQHKMYSRLEAMRVAKEQAEVRERAADFVREGREVPRDLMTGYQKTVRQLVSSRKPGLDAARAAENTARRPSASLEGRNWREPAPSAEEQMRQWQQRQLQGPQQGGSQASKHPWWQETTTPSTSMR